MDQYEGSSIFIGVYVCMYMHIYMYITQSSVLAFSLARQILHSFSGDVQYMYGRRGGRRANRMGMSELCHGRGVLYSCSS